MTKKQSEKKFLNIRCKIMVQISTRYKKQRYHWVNLTNILKYDLKATCKCNVCKLIWRYTKIDSLKITLITPPVLTRLFLKHFISSPTIGFLATEFWWLTRFILFISSLFKVDLHLAYKKPINVNNNTAHKSVNKLPSNNDNNKTKYLIVRQNQHVANRLYITYMGNQPSTFLFFVWKILDHHDFWLFWGQVSIFFGAM